MPNKETMDVTMLLRYVAKADPHNDLLTALQDLIEKRNIDALVLELRYFASNTLLRPFRDEPIDYDEIVRDVAEKIGVPGDDISDNTTENEQLCLGVVIAKYFEKMTPHERKEALSGLGDVLSDEYKDVLKNIIAGGIGAGAGAGLFVLLINQLGKQVLLQIIRQIGLRGAAFYATVGAANWVAALAPGLNILFAGWLAIDAAGPAYRKTVPAVIYIALLRLHFGAEALGE